MEIAVNIDAEDLLQGTRQCCITAYFTFVALGENLEPIKVPRLRLENAMEEEEFEAGRLRSIARKENPKVCWLSLY
jgi:acyl-CoA hydrolase